VSTESIELPQAMTPVNGSSNGVEWLETDCFRNVQTKPARLAILCDIVQENWPSMDLVGEMLYENLQKNHAASFNVIRLAPQLRRRFTRGQTVSGRFFNADRFMNRFMDYPRAARRLRAEFDLFHVIDHSYGQLIHELPPERTIITCHDLDTFQCLLEPAREPRSVLFRKMMSRTLRGFQQAALVVCPSAATRDQLVRYRLVAPERAVVVTNGVHPSCSPGANPIADREAERLLGAAGGLEILHVGSTIPRKRVDVLLQIFGAVRKNFPAARLIRVGGAFTREQEQLVDQLGLAGAIVVLPQLERAVLASVYRRAALVLLPSEREGFGLPLVEALACGTPVVASDLPVLREVGGDAASYAPVAHVPAWTATIIELLREREQGTAQWAARRARGVERAGKFGWAEYANRMVELYRKILPRGTEPH